MKTQVSDIFIFTDLLDGGCFVRCTCGFCQRWTPSCQTLCVSCGRTRSSQVVITKEEWKTFRDDLKKDQEK